MIHVYESTGVGITAVIILSLYLLQRVPEARKTSMRKNLMLLVLGIMVGGSLVRVVFYLTTSFFTNGDVLLDLRADHLIRGEDPSRQYNKRLRAPSDLCTKLLSENFDLLHEVEERGICNVIILDGSSVSSRGIDGAKLEAKLNQEGFSTRVVQFTPVGAGHYERSALIQEEIERRNFFYDHPSVNLILIREVHLLWDRDFLANIESNLMSDVTQGYIGIPTSVLMIKHDLIRKHENRDFSFVRFNFYVKLLREGIIRDLGLGWYGKLNKTRLGRRYMHGYRPIGTLQRKPIDLLSRELESNIEAGKICRSRNNEYAPIFQGDNVNNNREMHCRDDCVGYELNLKTTDFRDYRLVDKLFDIHLINRKGTITKTWSTNFIDHFVFSIFPSEWKQLLICAEVDESLTSDLEFGLNIIGLAPEYGSETMDDRELIQQQLNIAIQPDSQLQLRGAESIIQTSKIIEEGVDLRNILISRFRGKVDSTVWYTTPNLLSKDRAYYRAACKRLACIVAPTTMDEFLKNSNINEWKDESHLTIGGAARFTSLFVNSLLNSNVLRR